MPAELCNDGRHLRSRGALADEITTLCGHIHAAEYRLLWLVRELDEKQPWATLDVLSCAHWLNWRGGIALGAARERVRVARALPKLPKIKAAFRDGKLSERQTYARSVAHFRDSVAGM